MCLLKGFAKFQTEITYVEDDPSSLNICIPWRVTKRVFDNNLIKHV